MAFCFRMVVKTAENDGPFPLSAEHYEHLLNFRFDNKNHLKKGIIGQDRNCRTITVIHSRSALHLFLNVYFGLFFELEACQKSRKWPENDRQSTEKNKSSFQKHAFLTHQFFGTFCRKLGKVGANRIQPQMT